MNASTKSPTTTTSTILVIAGARVEAGFDPADEVSTRVSALRALQTLPPAEREALTLVAWEGLDVREGAIAAYRAAI